MDTRDRVFNERFKRHCCSESIMNMCLEDMGRDPESNKDLVKAMGAFCGGLHEGLACGALCAAVAVLWLAEEDPVKAHDKIGPEMMAWFKKQYGAWNCEDLLEGDKKRMATLCPVIMEETYIKTREMLEDIGY